MAGRLIAGVDRPVTGRGLLRACRRQNRTDQGRRQRHDRRVEQTDAEGARAHGDYNTADKPGVTPPATPPRTRTKTRFVGSDRVELRENGLTVVSAARHMPGWHVRRYRSPVIHFDNRTWRVVARNTAPDGLTHYDLAAWQPIDGEIPGPEIVYSAEYVALRDYKLAVGRRRGRITLVLNAASPFIGLLPARAKERLEDLYGIDPVASTFASIVMEGVVVLGSFALASIGVMVQVWGANSGLPAIPAVAVGVVLLIDAAARWSRLLGEERPGPGFFEWLFH